MEEENVVDVTEELVEYDGDEEGDYQPSEEEAEEEEEEGEEESEYRPPAKIHLRLRGPVVPPPTLEEDEREVDESFEDDDGDGDFEL